ncbi:DNA methyltransferase [Larkinella soli]|uniref:DNA methyltransferase n=1 Tax=Larkinella soli TaxID=1770527 RepID=UPI000FFC5D3B|nr:DNA methyltransferase [Larkinella soli]
MINLHLGDSLEAMRQMPDKAYDLAIVDPPYGIGEDGGTNHTRSLLAKAKSFTSKGWDKDPPKAEYFRELRRVSKNQIIWGANHFISRLPIDSSCWIVWDKDNGQNDFADCELAWSSFPTAVRKFKWRWQGMLQENMKDKQIRIHPTEKPVALYKWLLKNYAKPGDKILDTHLGSMSIALACHDMGYDLDGWEIDPEYYQKGVERYQNHIKQLSLFPAAV